MPKTATIPTLILCGTRADWTPGELDFARWLTIFLHTYARRGDLHLAPPARPA